MGLPLRNKEVSEYILERIDKFEDFESTHTKLCPHHMAIGVGIEVFGPENFLSVFQKQGEILILKKMLNFLSFLVLLYVSGHFKQKKISKFFPTDRKILTRHQFM